MEDGWAAALLDTVCDWNMVSWDEETQLQAHIPEGGDVLHATRLRDLRVQVSAGLYRISSRELAEGFLVRGVQGACRLQA